MIVPGPEDDKKRASAPPSEVSETDSSVTVSDSTELPPAYADAASVPVDVHRAEFPEPPTSPRIAGPSSVPPFSPGPSNFRDGPPPGIRPGNHVLVSRGNDSVKGVFVIDPTLAIPEPALPPLPEGETRENLFLESHNGAVRSDVHVWVAPGTMPEKKTLRATVRAKSHNGGVSLRLRRDVLTTVPVFLTCTSKNGGVEVYIPQSFVGPFSMTSKNGSFKRSEAVTAMSTLFYEANGTQRGFIGDHSTTDWGSDPAAWQGDTLYLESSNGSCKVYYVDELDVPPSVDGGKGFFAKLFGGK